MVTTQMIMFDALRGAAAPTELFGPLLTGSSHLVAAQRLESLAVTARARVAKIFHQTIADDETGVRALDEIIRDMWANAWSPDVGDIKLFTVHFGTLFSRALIAVAGVVPVFRSEDTLDHFSAWLPPVQLEVFPFHKTHKALLHREGESLIQVYDEIRRDSVA